MVWAPMSRLPISWRTKTKRAMSIAKAMRVSRAAKNATKEAINVTVICVDSPRISAMKVTAVARTFL